MVTSASLALERLSRRESEALHAFTERLLDAFGESVWQIILFGSKARGDSTAFSDIDVLIIADEEDWQQRALMGKIASDVDLDFDVLLNIFLISADRWRWMSEVGFPLCRNVEREGILLFRRDGVQATVS